jgi:hypothetical protein
MNPLAILSDVGEAINLGLTHGVPLGRAEHGTH